MQIKLLPSIVKIFSLMLTFSVFLQKIESQITIEFKMKYQYILVRLSSKLFDLSRFRSSFTDRA